MCCILYYVTEASVSLPDVITSGQSSKNPLIKVNIALVILCYIGWTSSHSCAIKGA